MSATLSRNIRFGVSSQSLLLCKSSMSSSPEELIDFVCVLRERGSTSTRSPKRDTERSQGDSRVTSLSMPGWNQLCWGSRPTPSLARPQSLSSGPNLVFKVVLDVFILVWCPRRLELQEFTLYVRSSVGAWGFGLELWDS